MADHTKVCWYCKSKNVEPVETWYQCRDCGATYTPLTTLGDDALKRGSVKGSIRGKSYTRPANHPTESVIKEAAKAREAAKAALGSPDPEVPVES